MENFSFTDIGIMVIVLISTVIGIYRGFFREMITIVVWLIGIVLAYSHGPDVAVALSFISSEYARTAIGMSVIFIGVVLIGMLVKKLVFKSFHIAKPSAFDRFLGAAFGVARGFGLIIIAIIAFQSTPVLDSDWYNDSQILPPLEDAADDISGQVPDKWQKWKHAVPKAGAAASSSAAPTIPAATTTTITTTTAVIPAVPAAPGAAAPTTTVQPPAANVPVTPAAPTTNAPKTSTPVTPGPEYEIIKPDKKS
jgi:membrane protein required for colicin V production